MSRASLTVRNDRGMTLIELLVALTIGLFIVGGLVVLLTSSKTNYEVQSYSARLQENARFAMQFLGYDLRLSGYTGCADLSALTSVQGQTPTSYGDSVQYTYANPNAALTLTSDANIGDTTIDVSDASGLVVGQAIAIADCGSTVEVDITAKSGNTLTIDPGLNRRFQIAYTEIRPFNTYTFDVQQSGATNIPGLHRDGLELVEGIEYLRLLYGEDTDGDGIADFYRSEDQVSNWGAVNSIKIGILVRSISNYDPSANPDREFGTDLDETAGPYDVLDQSVTPPQGTIRAQRRVFTSTFLIRNLS